jgi:urease accessory protein
MVRSICRIAPYALAGLSGDTLAHHFMDDALPQTFVQGLLSGLGHPLIGPDHAAFILAAGFALALVARGMWGVAALIAGSLLGAALHLWGVELPWGETGIALSVVLVGGLVLARRTIPLALLAGGIAVAGMLHGHAYAESIFGAEAAPLGAYLVGFSITQLCVAAGALLVHRSLTAANRQWAAAASAALGAIAVVTGGVFLVTGAAG